MQLKLEDKKWHYLLTYFLSNEIRSWFCSQIIFLYSQEFIYIYINEVALFNPYKNLTYYLILLSKRACYKFKKISTIKTQCDTNKS